MPQGKSKTKVKSARVAKKPNLKSIKKKKPAAAKKKAKNALKTTMNKRAEVEIRAKAVAGGAKASKQGKKKKK